MSHPLDVAIKEKYGRSFRYLNPDELQRVKSKMQAKVSGDLWQICSTLLDAAIEGDPWVDVFALHTRQGTGGAIMQSTARKADLNNMLREFGLGVCTCLEVVNGQDQPHYKVCFEDEVLRSTTSRTKSGEFRVRPYHVVHLEPKTHPKHTGRPILSEKVIQAIPKHPEEIRQLPLRLLSLADVREYTRYRDPGDAGRR